MFGTGSIDLVNVNLVTRTSTGTGSVLLIPDDRKSRNDASTDSIGEQIKATAMTISTSTAAETVDKADSLLNQAVVANMNLKKGNEHALEPTIIPSSNSAVSVFQQTPSTRKFDADWKTSLKVTPLYFRGRYDTHPTLISNLIFPSLTGSSIAVLCT